MKDRGYIRNMIYLSDLIVHFKSSPIYFEKERSGLKSNTIREINLSEDKFQDLILMYNFGIYGYIQIRETKEDKPEMFDRKIKDITIWNNLMIISW